LGGTCYLFDGFGDLLPAGKLMCSGLRDTRYGLRVTGYVLRVTVRIGEKRVKGIELDTERESTGSN
ncbi:MAG: hypothetical protein OES70_15075, partial [Desulfobacterales bacterium]|nr:hypothetical protein [Desulfobacterales bacterium]